MSLVFWVIVRRRNHYLESNEENLSPTCQTNTPDQFKANIHHQNLSLEGVKIAPIIIDEEQPTADNSKSYPQKVEMQEPCQTGQNILLELSLNEV